MIAINTNDGNGGGSGGGLINNTQTGGGIFTNSLPIVTPTTQQTVDGNYFIDQSTTSTPVQFVQLNPTITMTTPHVDPPFTYRALTVRDMYSFVMSVPSVNFTYEVGRPVSVIPVTCSFRNNTVNTTLQLDFNVPDFITLSIGSSVLVSSDQIIKFFLMLNENSSKQLVNTSDTTFEEFIEIKVTPSNILEPVYVRNNLQSLSIQ